MKKLKLEELQVNSLATSLEASEEEVKGGTFPTPVTYVTIVASLAMISYVTVVGTGY